MSRRERTGWRDEALSRRHRLWGVNCPIVDIDWMVVEYENSRPKAIIDYKHHRLGSADLDDPNVRALAALANRAPPIPFMLVWYWENPWAFYVYPVNEAAQAIYLPNLRSLSERRFVESIHHLRGFVAEKRVLRRLCDASPPAALPKIYGGKDSPFGRCIPSLRRP